MYVNEVWKREAFEGPSWMVRIISALRRGGGVSGVLMPVYVNGIRGWCLGRCNEKKRECRNEKPQGSC